MARSPNRGSTFVPDPLWFAIVASSRADVGRHPFLIRNLGVTVAVGQVPRNRASLGRIARQGAFKCPLLHFRGVV